MAKHEVIDAETGEVLNHANAVAMASPRPDPNGGILAVIERVAMDPNSDVEKLERMLGMKERLDERAREDEDRAARRQFFTDLTAAQSAIPVVLKNRRNTFNNSTYADMAAIEVDAMPVIRQHGFSVSAKSIPGAEAGYQRVVFRVAHRDGHVDEYEDDFPLDNQGTGGKASKTNIQAKGSTVHYARRYMLCAYFNIAVADADGVPQRESQTAAIAAPTELTAGQAKTLRDLIVATKTNEAKFLAAANAATIEAIAPKDFPRLEGLLKRKQAEASSAAPAVAA